MKTVYFGTSEFAATVLRSLSESDHRPNLVVTRPARPKGRGRALVEPPVALLAGELGIDVFQPEKVNEPDSVARIAAAAPAATVVCAYGALIGDPILELSQSFNVHPSLLPRWRGAAPIERAIAAGDAETGVCVMALIAELDAGPVCARATETIRPEDDFGTLSDRLSGVGSKLLVDALNQAAAGGIRWQEQPASGDPAVTYAEKITREDRMLKATSATAVELDRMVRALHPHIGAFFVLADQSPLAIEQARPARDDVSSGDVEVVDGRLLVGTTSGSLELVQVKPAGGKSMDAASYLRGRGVPALAPPAPE